MNWVRWLAAPSVLLALAGFAQGVIVQPRPHTALFPGEQWEMHDRGGVGAWRTGWR